MAIAAYTIELGICLLADFYNWPYLWLCYINPWFRIFGEGFLGILLCVNMERFTKKLKYSNKYEYIALALFICGFLVRNIKTNIFFTWIQTIPMAFLIIAFRQGTGNISKVLKTRVFQFFGNISFELYMTHAFVYEGIPIVIGLISAKYTNWLLTHAGTRFVITIIMCIIVAWFVHIIMGWIKKMYMVK